MSILDHDSIIPFSSYNGLSPVRVHQKTSELCVRLQEAASFGLNPAILKQPSQGHACYAQSHGECGDPPKKSQPSADGELTHHP